MSDALLAQIIAEVVALRQRVGDLERQEATGTPSGIIALHATACPNGWTEYTAARGRVVVGVPAGGTLAGTVGSALGNLASRTITDLPSHTHGVGTLANGGADTDHTHGVGTFTLGGQSGDHTHSFSTGGASADHTHGGSTLSTSDPGNHYHGVYRQDTAGAPNSIATIQSATAATFALTTSPQQTENKGAHTHTISGSTGGRSADHTHSGGTNGVSAGHNHGLSGSTGTMSATHSHGLSGSTAAFGSASTDVTMPYIQLLYCQKA